MENLPEFKNQLSLQLHLLKPITECKKIPLNGIYYYDNAQLNADGQPKKKQDNHWRFTRMTLIGFKENGLHFKYPDGSLKELGYGTWNRIYILPQ